MCNAKNKITLMCAKFGADLINTSKVTNRKTRWPRFLRHSLSTMFHRHVGGLPTSRIHWAISSHDYMAYCVLAIYYCIKQDMPI